jgi:maleate isomerase
MTAEVSPKKRLRVIVLEARIGKRVVTSTQATLWHVLRLAGVDTPIPGYGRLLCEH